MRGLEHRPFSTEPVPFRRDTGERFVIVGNGAAGLAAAAAIRTRNRTASIVMAGAEPWDSYSRPMLTKAQLVGFDPSVFTVFGPSWYGENRIERITGAAVSVDPADRTVAFDDGRTLAYDRCILATGARSFIPPIPGVEQERVYPVRSLGDIAALRRALLGAKRAVVIGGGVVGLEIAWELHRAGLSLTVLEAAPTLIGRLLDGGSALRLQGRLEAAGVAVRTGVRIDAVTGSGVASGVRLCDGTAYPADLVAVSCGSLPETALARMAGAEVGRAVAVNDRMETTILGLYACGDCAQNRGKSPGVWPVAVEQGRVAGANAAGDAVRYLPPPAGVVFHGFGVSLYAVGDMTPDLAVTVLEEKRPSGGFLVNPRIGAGACAALARDGDGTIRGGVLMDDLRDMAALDAAVARGLDLEQYNHLRGEGGL